MKKIDAHSHIGNFGGWASVSIDIDNLIKQMDNFQIEKVVLCGTSYLDNDNVSLAYKKYKDRVLPIVYSNPFEGDEAIKKIYRYVENEGFLGIKLNPLKDAYIADSEILNPIMEAAEDLNLTVFIHCGHPPYSLPWSIALLAERYPKVNIVMIHMGHGHGVYIDASIKMAKRYNNLYLEMSGMPMGSKIKEAYKSVGHNRMLFGVDAPFHHPSVEIQKVITCGLKDKELEDIFYNNISKLLNL